MLIFVFILLILHVFQNTYAPYVNETELILSFLVHRHGDRTPLKDSLVFSNNPGELYKLSQPYGFEELTERGIKTSYELGKFIRRRYSSLLSRIYKPWEIYVRSTFTTRTVTTAMVSLAATYYIDMDSWTDVMTWKRLPYDTVIPKYDYNTPFLNCPKLIRKMEEVKYLRPPELNKYQGLFDKLSEEVPFNISESPFMIIPLCELFICQLHLDLPLSETAQELLSEIKEAADEALDLYCGSGENIPLQAGVLLRQFLKVASRAVTGLPTYKVYQFSVHDFNVYSFEAVTKVTPRQGFPEYGSMLALELRLDKTTNTYYVLPVYLSSPWEPEIYLRVNGCPGNVLCEFKQFVHLTFENSLEINEWRKKCGFQETYPINYDSFE